MSPNPPTAVVASNSKAQTQTTNPNVYHNVQNYIKELEISEGQLSSVLK